MTGSELQFVADLEEGLSHAEGVMQEQTESVAALTSRVEANTAAVVALTAAINGAPRTFASHRETLAEIARLVATLPGATGSRLLVAPDSQESVEMIKAAGGDVHTAKYPDRQVTVAAATVGELDIQAWQRRKAGL